jgi:hypothetical protein
MIDGSLYVMAGLVAAIYSFGLDRCMTVFQPASDVCSLFD